MRARWLGLVAGLVGLASAAGCCHCRCCGFTRGSDRPPDGYHYELQPPPPESPPAARIPPPNVPTGAPKQTGAYGGS